MDLAPLSPNFLARRRASSGQHRAQSAPQGTSRANLTDRERHWSLKKRSRLDATSIFSAKAKSWSLHLLITWARRPADGQRFLVSTWARPASWSSAKRPLTALTKVRCRRRRRSSPDGSTVPREISPVTRSQSLMTSIGSQLHRHPDEQLAEKEDVALSSSSSSILQFSKKCVFSSRLSAGRAKQ